MNLSQSENRKGPESPYVFISIFYAREKWHELLPVIQQSLMQQQRWQSQPDQSFVFFSSHRGSSIRLALKYDDPNRKEDYMDVLNPIIQYMEKHPSFTHRLQLPITSFFLDFPSNSIQYNLYSERNIAPGGLSHFQVLLSQIMLQFFEDHAVNDEGIFTLIIWLQEAILNGLSNVGRSKHDLIEEIIDQMKQREHAVVLEPYQLEATEPFEDLESYMVNANLENLFLQIDLLAVLLNDRLQDPIEVYFVLLRLMREHLLKLSNEVILASLNYLNSPVPVEDPN